MISLKTGTKYIGIYGENKDNIELGKTYTFTIENRGVEDSGFEVYLESDTSNTIKESDISYTVTNEITTTSTLSSSRITYGNLLKNEKKTITLSLNSTKTGTYKGRLKIKYINYNRPTITYDYNYLPNDNFEGMFNISAFKRSNSSGNITSTQYTTDDVGKLFIVNSNTGWYFPGYAVLPEGTIYTWQAEVKSNKDEVIWIGHEQGGYIEYDISTNWQRITKTFTAISKAQIAFIFYERPAIYDEYFDLYVRNIQMQEGTLNTKEYTIITNILGSTIDTPTREGYAFDGWYTDAVEGEKISINTPTPTSNTTYYAHWKINK